MTLETRPATVRNKAAKLAEEKGISLEEAAAEIWTRAEAGEIRLIDPNPPESFQGYLFSWYSSWYWLIAAALTLMLAAVYILPQVPPIAWVRTLMGFMTSLYLPGYAFIEALYPQKGELEELERHALSVGLSLALTPLTGFVLNYTPWGIRLDPVATAITMLTLALGLVAVYRKYTYLKLSQQAEGQRPS